MIQFADVSKIYTKKENNESICAVKDVSFTVQEGDICGIIGYSGAGKSTLLRMVNGLETPTNGEITVAGQKITQLKGKQLRQARQKMGMIFQHFHLLWSRTVRENIAFPLEVMKFSRASIHQRVDYLLDRVGLMDRADAYPSQLSGGQKQRVGIARALAAEPAVLLCDEPTSALDPETTDSILQLLQDINQDLGITILLITHEASVIRAICKHVIVMDQGEIVEEGTVKDVFHRPQHPLTKAFVTSTEDAKIKKKTYTISLKQISQWSQLHQLLAEYDVSLELHPSLPNQNESQLTFYLIGSFTHIEQAEQALKAKGWLVKAGDSDVQ